MACYSFFLWMLSVLISCFAVHDDQSHAHHGTNPFQSTPTERPLALSRSALGKVPRLAMAESAALERGPRRPGCTMPPVVALRCLRPVMGLHSTEWTEEGLCCQWWAWFGSRSEMPCRSLFFLVTGNSRLCINVAIDSGRMGLGLSQWQCDIKHAAT